VFTGTRFSAATGVIPKQAGRRQRRGLDLGDLGSEAIAVTDHGLYAAALRAVLVEDVPQLRYLDVQVGFLDHPSRPDGGGELVLRDEFTFPSDQ
jgi:hypothetical protein